jgi:hypothetical protein
VVFRRKDSDTCPFQHPSYSTGSHYFLKYNKKYWNNSTVVEAIKLLKEVDRNERYNKEMGPFGVLDNDYD